jgi:hypothetical protein
MKETINLKARWGARKQPSRECAATLAAFLGDLATCDEIFSKGWLPSAKSIEEAKLKQLNKIGLSVDSLQIFLEENRVRCSSDNSVIEDLGFMPGRLWNDCKSGTVYLWIQCGAYPDPAILPGINALWLGFPSEERIRERILRSQTLIHLVNLVVKHWDPDWLRISTDKMDGAVHPQNPYIGQLVGWLTYVSDRYGPLPPLPSSCNVMRVGALGNLITVSSIKEVLTASNPEHISCIGELSDILRGNGFLAPVPPNRTLA